MWLLTLCLCGWDCFSSSPLCGFRTQNLWSSLSDKCFNPNHLPARKFCLFNLIFFPLLVVLSSEICSISLVSGTFWTTMLCVLCHISWTLRFTLYSAPLVFYTDWAKPRLSNGHWCPCIDQWWYQWVCIRGCASVFNDVFLAPWFPRAQKLGIFLKC